MKIRFVSSGVFQELEHLNSGNCPVLVRIMSLSFLELRVGGALEMQQEPGSLGSAVA